MGTTGKGRVNGDGMPRWVPWAAPWVVLLGSLPVAWIAHSVWGTDPKAAPWWSMAALSGSAALSAFTLRLTRARSELVGYLATASVAAAGVWLIAASLVGPFVRPLIDLWAVGGGLMAAAWTIRRATLNADEAGGKEPSPLEKALGGAKVRRPKVVDGQVTAKVETNRAEGQTITDLQRAAPSLEVVTKVRPGAIRIAQDPDDAGRGTLVIVPTDPLVEPRDWPGPSRPGASIHEPLPVGTYEDALPALIWLTGDEQTARALAMWLVMGATGAGKTQAMVTLMADVLTRSEVSVIASDHVKGTQSLGALVDDLEWYATTKQSARAMVAKLRDAVRARTEWLGRHGHDQWEPGCGLNLVIAWFEEATELVEDSTAMKLLVSQARSAGIVVIISQQRSSHQSIDTDTRAQLNGNVCFGVRDSTDAGFALPDDVIDAGARPEVWQNRKPGYCYLVGPGIAEDRYPVPLRFYRSSKDQIRAALAEYRHLRTPLDSVTVEAFGEPYAQFKAARQRGEALATVPFAVLPEPDPEQGWNDPDDPDEPDDEEGLEPMPDELDPDITVDPDNPVGEPPFDVPFGVPAGEKLSTVQARQVVQQHLRTLMEQGKTHTQPADVCAMKPGTTRTREWVRQELHRLCESPGVGEIALERHPDDDPGVFRILALTGAVVGDGV